MKRVVSFITVLALVLCLTNPVKIVDKAAATSIPRFNKISTIAKHLNKRINKRENKIEFYSTLDCDDWLIYSDVDEALRSLGGQYVYTVFMMPVHSTRLRSGKGYKNTYRLQYYDSVSHNDYVVSFAKDFAKKLQECSDYEKVKTIHDYIINYVKYDNTGFILDTAYEALTKQKANDTAIAWLFYEMCRAADIKCWGITGEITGRPNDESWNAVQIGKKLYYVDVAGDAVSTQKGLSKYKWFLKGSKSFKKKYKVECNTTIAKKVSKLGYKNKG